jgi:ATP phosphoribosyltransferase
MSKLKMAIQKSGRLNADSIQLLKSCGIRIENGKDQLKVSVPNFPIDILYLRNSDIPQYLEDGVVDAAIIGENLLIEQNKKVNVLQKLGFSKCRVSLAVPKSVNTQGPSYFNGKKNCHVLPQYRSKILFRKKDPTRNTRHFRIRRNRPQYRTCRWNM